MKTVYFRSAAEFRKWLRANHRTARELLVGYYKKDSGRPSLTWPESVAEALCFGWIDGIRQRVDGRRYTIRFTPRRPRSSWSEINVRLVGEMEAAGKMTAAGLAAFAARDPKKTQRSRTALHNNIRLAPRLSRQFKKHKAAWKFFSVQLPGYRNLMISWVMDAKTEATRERRLARLVQSAAAGKR